MFIGASPSVYELFSMILVPQFKLRTEKVFNCLEAIETINERDYEVIVMCLPVNDDPKVLFDFLKQFKKQIPILFTADENNMSMIHDMVPYHPQCTKVCYNSGSGAIKASINKLLRISAQRQKSLENYYPMPSEYFVSTKIAPFDIFIKISDEKYIRIYKEGDELSRNDIIKYKEKNVHEFYLKTSDFEKASHEFMQRISKGIESRELKTDVLSSVAKFGHESVCRLVLELGVKDEVLEIADSSIKAVSRIAKSSPKLSGFIANILEGKSYLSEHTIMISILSVAMAKEVAWGSEDIADKLTMSAFFHDIALEDVDLELTENLDSKNIGDSKLRRYKLHPKKAIEFLQDINGLPPDVDRIIENHHEKPDGSGFPHAKTWKSLFPLAAIFIVAEDFSQCLYEGGMELEFLHDILDDFDEKYNRGNFKLAMKGLRKALALEAIEEIDDEYLKKLA